MTTKTSPKPEHISQSSIPDAQEERAARTRYIAALIAQGEEEIAAGLGIAGDDLESWLNQLDADPNAPMPQPKRLKP